MSILNKVRLVIFTMMMIFTTATFGVTVTQVPSTLNTFNSQWQWAQTQIENSEDSAWIGYTIDKADSLNVHRHCYGSEKYTTLTELLKSCGITTSHFKSKTALLFHVSQEKELIEFKIADDDSHIKLKNRPVFWLGNHTHDESVSHIIQMYSKTEDIDNKKDLILGVALHSASDKPLPFLKKVAQSQSHTELRKSAVFWMGQYHEEELDFLINLAKNDRSDEVQKSAIFAISQSDTKRAFDALIHIAKKHHEMEMRKQAIFWLSQQGNEDAGDALKEMVYDQETVELQKHAVFALSQWQGKEAVNDLLKIIKDHPNSKIRKQAVFWLGQTDDPKALDALVGIIEKRRN